MQVVHSAPSSCLPASTRRAVSAKWCSSSQLCRQWRRRRRYPQRTTLCMVLGEVQEVPQAAASWLPAGGLQLIQLLQLTLASLAAYAAAVWPERPRGWCRKDLIQVGGSSLQGLGVFAKAPLAAGTVLGSYPGRPRTPAAMVAKAGVAPSAATYCFQTRDGWVLDPTDACGAPSAFPSPGLPWLPIDPTLSRVNEPAPGSAGPNVAVEDDPGDTLGLLFVASRDVAAGEELLIDYGPVYDRRAYGGPQ